MPVNLSSVLADPPPSAGALPPHISFSQIDAFNRCPRSYQAQRIHGVREPVQEALAVGSSVHHAIGAYFTSLMRQTRIAKSQREMEALQAGSDLLDDIVDKAINEPDQQLGFERDINDVENEVEQLVLTYIKERPAFKPSGVEEPIRLDLPDADIPLIGSIDAVGEDAAGQPVILEIKTSKATVNKPKGSWRLQALIYQAARPGYRADFHVLVKNKTPKLVHGAALSQQYDANASREALNLANQTAHQIQTMFDKFGAEEPWPATGALHPFACGFCPIKTTCKLGAGS